MKLPLLFRPLVCACVLFGVQAGASAQQMPFAGCIEALRAELPNHPAVRADTFVTHASQANDLRPPIDSATSSQPEFELPIWDYLDRLIDAQRIDDGRAALAQQAPTLHRIVERFGVDAATLVAVFGIESDFGRLKGRHKVVDATLSRACLRLSSQDRKAQFFAALWLLQEGLVDAEQFRGSWAGAFGMTQFMPATFKRHMADGDGDGVIDTVGNAADALATTASYLQHLGWDPLLPWGIEVQAPIDLVRRSSSAGREHRCLEQAAPDGRCQALARWAALGVSRADGSPLLGRAGSAAGIDPATPAALLAPAGAEGPMWLVTRNFQALWNYNRADSYALAIGLLSSALRGGAPPLRRWPVSDEQRLLPRRGMMALQALLRDAGQCGIDVDGFDGPKTRQAIRNEEVRRGLPESGRPTSVLLERLRVVAATAPPADCSKAAAPENSDDAG
ncbi:lytic murein transglycosylase [Piscinibacter sakaiensis]|uniref:lytic murein transglycosylase n=1 Tax=Piscinibacter sakaiensis TaxID=1547922 RepID=UPI003AAD140B